MSKFNSAAETIKTVNNEGHSAYRMDWRSKLMTMVLTSFFNEAKFYGDNSEELENVLRSGIIDDPEFVANLAAFARREFNMRSVSHVIAGYLAKIPEGKPYVKKTLKRIILRGDDATEILAFYLNTFGKPIPNSLRKGLREVFPTFDAYTLAKYKSEGNAVKMRDILCLCRPVPKDDEQSKVWKDLLEGHIQPAYTWETELSAKGNNRETWESLIDSGRVGYMALLRNLRNIINAQPHNIQKVYDQIANPEAVRKSRQLPFRFLSAWMNLPTGTFEARDARPCLEKAFNASLDNLPKIHGKTVIAIDVSGSMCSRISSKSDIHCSQIAMLLGLAANKMCEKAIVWTFDHELKELYLSQGTDILQYVAQYEPRGGGTNMYLPIAKMLTTHLDADRLIILSDNECNCAFDPEAGNYWYATYYGNGHTVQSLVDRYRDAVNPNLWVHAVDLQGYGTQQFNGGKTNLISGWSEKILEFITLAEQGEETLIKRIQNYKANE